MLLDQIFKSNNVKIFHKFSVFIFITAICAYIAVSITYFYTMKIYNSLLTLYNKDLLSIVLVKTIQSNFNNIKADSYKLIIAKDGTTKNNLINEIHTLQKENHNLLEKYKNNNPNSEEQQKLSALTESLNVFRSVQNSVILLVRYNDYEYANKILFYNENIQSKVNYDTANLLNCIQDNLNNKKIKSYKVITLLRNIFITKMLIVLLLIFIAVFRTPTLSEV